MDTTQLKKAAAVRGKLNVPRERFQKTGTGSIFGPARIDPAAPAG